MAVDRRTFLEWPRPRAIWREARTSLASFVRTALPVFAAICVVAAVLEYAGALDRLGVALEPAMGVFALRRRPRFRSFSPRFARTVSRC